MVDVTYSRIFLNASKIKCVLMTKWGPDDTVNVHVATRESAWVGELSGPDIKSWVEDHELELQHFIEEMKGALGGEHKSENLLYSLDSGTFSWKRVLSSGMIAILGQMKVKNVPVVDTYEAILDKSLDNLVHLQKQVTELRDENSSLIKDRDSAIARVTEFAAVKEEWEKKLYGRFAALLNTKKAKIDTLDMELMYLRNKEPMDEGEQEEGAAASSNRKKDDWRRKDETTDEDTEDDPYRGETDVDSDNTSDTDVRSTASLRGPPPSSKSTPSMSTTLRRNRDMFDSFDSPGCPSPAPVLPKRARMPPKASTFTSASAAGAMGRNVFKNVVQVQHEDEDNDDDMKPLTLDAADADEDNFGENTQDLLDNM